MFGFLGSLLGLAAIGAPLFVLMGVATALCFAFFVSDVHSLKDLLPIMQNMEGLLNKQEFLAIPLFMASGAIMTAGGMATRLVNIAKAGLGWMPGGMAVASVAACMFFAAISGSSPVTLIAVGSIMVPAMVESKYPENFSMGLVTTAGSLGCLVPPSISMLIYAISISGSSAAVSPDDLFLAGLLPALMISGFLAIYSVIVGLRVPGSRGTFKMSEFRTAVREGVWALLLPLIVLGGIYGGLYTPSEAGAVACIYALGVTMFIYKELPVRRLFATLMDAAGLMGSLLLIIVLAFGLNEFLALIGIQERMMDLIREFNLGPVGFLLLVNVALVVIGALMDSISCTLIFAPLLAPVAWELYGIDPLHFGVVFVVNMEIGYLMPPVATNLFVASAVFKKPFGQVTKAVLPSLGITIFALGLIMYVPSISKAAVNLKSGKPAYQAFPWNGRPQPAGTPATGVAGETTGGAAAPDPAAAAPAGGSVMGRLTKHSMDDWEDEEEESSTDAQSAPKVDALGIMDAGPAAPTP